MTTVRGDLRVKLPKVLLRTFFEEPRIILPYPGVGIWPIEPAVLLESGILQKLVHDQEFQENFEIVIMPKR
ncbi:hypothetical protein ACFLYD_06160 [Chloroflexota bacterium]